MNFIKKLRPFDYIIIGIVVICVFVFSITMIGLRMTSGKKIEATTPVEIEVFFKGITISSNNSPFEVGDKTFITIRNVPYTKLDITKVIFERKKTIVPKGQSYQIVDDVTMPFQFDFLVTVKDEAKISDDGAVVGGNKIKIGLPVTLEGLDYRFNGVVSNITLPKENAENYEAK
ncbi:MAG: DUF4330 domain-containing protein [Cyanobacteria bacterium SIG30]|nr:DUF4330 domain-containing protein [Cyanobacteria bacterium SIG30]